jgi:hypothetical protein
MFSRLLLPSLMQPFSINRIPLFPPPVELGLGRVARTPTDDFRAEDATFFLSEKAHAMEITKGACEVFLAEACLICTSLFADLILDKII